MHLSGLGPPPNRRVKGAISRRLGALDDPSAAYPVTTNRSAAKVHRKARHSHTWPPPPWWKWGCPGGPIYAAKKSHLGAARAHARERPANLSASALKLQCPRTGRPTDFRLRLISYRLTLPGR